MDNDWTREIERLTDLLKKSEEEMLFWRREFRLLNAAETKAEEEIKRLQDENAALEAEVERLKKPKGFHDVSDLYEEASHE